jgi:hypothetical protein
MVGVDFPEGIHYIRIAVKLEDLFLCSYGELAWALDVLGVGEVESTKAGLGEVREEDIPPLAKVSLPHFVARLQVHRREELVDFDQCGQFVCNVVQLFVHSPEVVLVEACDVDQVVNTLVVVDNLHFQSGDVS